MTKPAPGAALLEVARRQNAEAETREPVWLASARREAAESFTAHGLPTPREEDWRFTSLAKIGELRFSPGTGRCEDVPTLPALSQAHRLVFVDGQIAPSLCDVGALPAGANVGSLGEAIGDSPEKLAGHLGGLVDAKKRALVALNTAGFRDGARIELAPDVALDRPIHLVHLTTTAEDAILAQPRNLIRLARGSRAIVVEHHMGAAGAPAWTNAVTEIELEANAHLDHVKLQEENALSFHTATVVARQAEGSRLRQHSIATGAALARVDIATELLGPGAHADLFGLFIAGGARHVDHHTTIDHAAPHTTSHELYRGVLDDRAKGVFHGRVHVRPDAQKIDAMQSCKTLLLSDGPTINAKPQLEIYADDVRCGHGATVGQIDPDALFYLRARGIGESEARAMLTTGFAAEAVDALPIEALRAYVSSFVGSWLRTDGGRSR